ncbi:hypothetical protein DFH28DRAFT_908030 [Melampsora americana]|nr:hypothetical protein DFH28DRAFT_908030 [Melampsora americana]
MSCFDAFLDSMYGPETPSPRKRTISHVDVSIQTPTPVAHHKRVKCTPYQHQALPYILTDREMSLADFQMELNHDREQERERESSLRFNEETALQKALALLMSPPTFTPAAISDIRSSPASSSSSATPSPVLSRNTLHPQHRYIRPEGPVTDPRRTIPELRVTEEIPDWVQLSKMFEEKEQAINYELLLVPGTYLPAVQNSLGTHSPVEDNSDNLSELEALIESYF